MIAAWMLFSVLTGGAVSLAAAAAARLAADRRRPARFVWLAALLATTCWPGLALVGAPGMVPPSAPAEGTPPAVMGVQRLSAFVVNASASALARQLDAALLVVWGVAAALLLARLTGAVRTVRRRRSEWRSTEVDGTPVRVSGDVGPALVGLRPMEVVLPEWALALDHPLRAMVLRHETEHRAARDPYLLLLAAVVTALVPWNVALWWQARQLRLAIEVDCDARVLRAHPRPERYALLLLAIAQRRGGSPQWLTAALSGPTSHLERRIIAMRTSRRSISRISAVALGAATAAALAVACSMEPPRQPTSPDDVPPVVRSAALPAAPTDSAAGAFFEFQVEKPADKISGPAPAYPDSLRSANVAGQVIAQFVVDTSGRADMSTFKALESDHALFTAAVERVVPQWRFVPAETGGRKIKQLVQLPFMFALSR